MYRRLIFREDRECLQKTDKCVIYASKLPLLCCAEPPVEFSKPLEDQTVEEEATATLECEVSRENAEVHWFRDGQDIRKTKKYEMIVDGCKRALIIHDCTMDDCRTYTCDAKDFKTSCFLTVEREYWTHNSSYPSTMPSVKNTREPGSG